MADGPIVLTSLPERRRLASRTASNRAASASRGLPRAQRSGTPFVQLPARVLDEGFGRTVAGGAAASGLGGAERPEGFRQVYCVSVIEDLVRRMQHMAVDVGVVRGARLDDLLGHLDRSPHAVVRGR